MGNFFLFLSWSNSCYLATSRLKCPLDLEKVVSVGWREAECDCQGNEEAEAVSGARDPGEQRRLPVNVSLESPGEGRARGWCLRNPSHSGMAKRRPFLLPRVKEEMVEKLA